MWSCPWLRCSRLRSALLRGPLTLAVVLLARYVTAAVPIVRAALAWWLVGHVPPREARHI